MCFTFTAQAQSMTEKYTKMLTDENLLQGGWVLERVNLHRAHELVNAEDFGIDIITEMEFKKESISIVSGERTFTGKFTNGEEYLSFDFSLEPFTAGWTVFDGQLFIEQVIELPHDDAHHESASAHAHAHGGCGDLHTVVIAYVFNRK